MPEVNVSVMIVKDGKMLMGLYKDAHVSKWNFPSVPLRVNESFEDCASRAVLDHTGMEIDSGEILYTTNDLYPGWHSVTVHMDAKLRHPEDSPVITGERRDFKEWEWFALFHPPEDLDMPAKHFFDANFICVDETEDLDFEAFEEA